jgi:hypothetical protein
LNKKPVRAGRYLKYYSNLGELLYFRAGSKAGNLIGYAHNSRAALGMVRKEKQQFVQAGQQSAPIPLRKKPARSTAMIEE